MKMSKVFHDKFLLLKPLLITPRKRLYHCRHKIKSLNKRLIKKKRKIFNKMITILAGPKLENYFKNLISLNSTLKKGHYLRGTFQRKLSVKVINSVVDLWICLRAPEVICAYHRWKQLSIKIYLFLLCRSLREAAWALERGVRHQVRILRKKSNKKDPIAKMFPRSIFHTTTTSCPFKSIIPWLSSKMGRIESSTGNSLIEGRAATQSVMKNRGLMLRSLTVMPYNSLFTILPWLTKQQWQLRVGICQLKSSSCLIMQTTSVQIRMEQSEV